MKSGGLTSNTRLGRELRDNLRAVEYCPVSGNQPLRCTRESFARACARQVALFDANGLGFNGYCGVCRGGNIPKNVEFIELEQLKGGEMPAFSRRKTENNEKTMGKRQKTDNPGKSADLPKTPVKKVDELDTCQCCGKSAAKLRPASGIRACASCGVMINLAKNRPQVVLEQMERLGKLAWASDGVEVNELKEEVEKLSSALAGWEKYHADAVATANATIAAAERSLDDALKQLADERETSAQLASKIEAMIDAELYGRTADSQVDCVITKVPEQPGATSRDTMLLDLALDVMAGKVTGLDHERLQAMRGVV